MDIKCKSCGNYLDDSAFWHGDMETEVCRGCMTMGKTVAGSAWTSDYQPKPKEPIRWFLVFGRAAQVFIILATTLALYLEVVSFNPPTLSVHPIERYCRMRAYQYAQAVDHRTFSAAGVEKVFNFCLNDYEKN